MKALTQIAVAALGTTFLAWSAQAAPIIVGSYYEDNVGIGCANVDSCAAPFSPIPAGAHILITNIACQIVVDDGSLLWAELTVGGSVRREMLQVGPARESLGDNRYSAGGEIKFFLTPGQRPSVLATTTTSATGIVLICRIVGTRPAPV